MKKLSNAIVLTFDENKSYICNICSDKITENIIALKCEPTKHIFCYDCILEWYSVLKKKKSAYTYSNNYSIITMCPVCRNDGGLLPCCYGEKFKGIHIIDKKQKEQQKINAHSKLLLRYYKYTQSYRGDAAPQATKCFYVLGAVGKNRCC